MRRLQRLVLAGLIMGIPAALADCTLVVGPQRHRGGDAGSAIDAPLLADAPGVDVPADTAPLDVGLDSPGLTDVPGDAGCVGPIRMMIVPAATGTVVFRPTLDPMLEANPAGAAMQSSYFRTTPENREFRRGLAELVIPTDAGLATSALLRFRTTSAPTEPHDVVSYLDANGLVTIMDYDRAGSPVGVVSTEAVDHTFDVLGLVRSRAGQPLGIRVQLAPPLDAATVNGSFGVEVRDLLLELELPCP